MKQVHLLRVNGNESIKEGRTAFFRMAVKIDSIIPLNLLWDMSDQLPVRVIRALGLSVEQTMRKWTI